MFADDAIGNAFVSALHLRCKQSSIEWSTTENLFFAYQTSNLRKMTL